METPKIFYKKLRDNEPVFQPTKRDEDADYDIIASVDTLVPAGETVGVPTNLAIEFPEDWEGKIENKSSISTKGITVLGGVIDHGYTGEIMAIMYNGSKIPYLFKAGNKVVQLKLRRRSSCFVFEEVQRPLRKSQRNDKAFGSTGI